MTKPMKNSRFVIVLALAASLLVSVAAFAQKHGKHGVKGLNLTADQKEKIHAIHEQQHTKIQELNKQALTRAQYREQAAAIRHSSQEQISNVLTPDQRAKMAARQSSRKANRKASRKAARRTQAL